jgi:hypothetical protein
MEEALNKLPDYTGSGLRIRFEAPTTMSTKNALFWDAAACSPAEVHQLFEIKYCLHFQSGQAKTREQQAQLSSA